MPVNLGLDDEVNEVSKKYLSGFRQRVERLLERAIKADSNPFNDGATASADDVVAVKTGSVIAFAGLDAPHGYLECNGAEVSSTQYSALAAVIGTLYGTAAAGKVKLPNAAQAAIAGAGGTRVAGVGTAVGDRFENNTTSLTIAHLPEHQHVIDTISEEDPGHVHDILTYPNFGINVPNNWRNADGSGGSNAGASFGEEWRAGEWQGVNPDDGAGIHQGIDDFRAARTRSYTTYTRSTTGDGPSSNPDDPAENAAKNIDLTQFGYDGPLIDLNKASSLKELGICRRQAFGLATGGLAAGVMFTGGVGGAAIPVRLCVLWWCSYI